MIWEKWKQFWLWTTTWERCYKQVWKRKRIFEECVCECWTRMYVRRENLLSWTSNNCWCVRRKKSAERCRGTKKHGLATDRIYQIYYSMVCRCKSPLCKAYKYYWWKWIKVLWNSFEDFYKDMGDSYKDHIREFWAKDTTIDRIDINWNYCKENCRWATIMEQNNNKSNNVCIEYNGETYSSMAALSRATWTDLGLLRNRLYHNRSVKDAVEKPRLY